MEEAGEKEEILSCYTASLESNSLSFQLRVCVQHLEFTLLCEKHMRLRGDLYARGAIQNCLLRDAALMSSLHVSQKLLGGEGQTRDWRFVLCHRHDCDQACSAVQSPSVSQRPLQRGRDVAHGHAALCSRELGWSITVFGQGGQYMSGTEGIKCP